MDLILGITRTGTTDRRAPPPKKLLEAYEREADATKAARQEMEKTFADALAELDDTFDVNLQRLSEAHARTSPTNADLPSPDLMIDYHVYLSQFDIAIERITKRYARTLYIPPVEISFADPIYDQKSYQGDEVVRKFRQVYNSFPEKPTSMQKRFIEASMATMAALLYGDEYSNDPEYGTFFFFFCIYFF